MNGVEDWWTAWTKSALRVRRGRVAATIANICSQLVLQGTVVIVYLYLGDAARLNCWLILLSVAGVTQMGVSGAAVTITRYAAYASARSWPSGPDFEAVKNISLAEVCTVGGSIVRAIGWWLGPGLVLASVPLAWPTILELDGEGFSSWMVLAIAVVTLTRNLAYQSILEGLDRIAWLRWGDATINLLAGLTAGAAAWLGFPLWVVAAIAFASWGLRLLRNRTQLRVEDQVREAREDWNGDSEGERFLYLHIRRRLVRSSAAVVMTYGLNHFISFGLSWFLAGAKLSSVLLAFRGMDVVGRFSQAPFYSRLPRLTQSIGSKSMHGIALAAGRSIGQSLWLVAIGAVVGLLVLEVAAASSLPATRLPANTIWFALCGALFLERLGAMHLQMYTAFTNRVRWHWANGGYSILLLAVGSVGLAWTSSVWAVFGGMLVAYLCWYVPFALRDTLTLGAGVLKQLLGPAGPPLGALSGIGVYIFAEGFLGL